MPRSALHLLAATAMAASMASVATGADALVELTAASFDQTVTNGSTWFVMLYAPWCGHCKRMAPMLEHIAEDYVDHPRIAVAKADVVEEAALAVRFLVSSFPKLVLVDGGYFPTVRAYTGARKEDEIRDYLEGGYLDQEPIPFWEPTNPMAPWVTFVFLFNPVRIVFYLLPFEVGLLGNGLLLVSLMAVYLAMLCGTVAALASVCCGRSCGKTKEETDDEDRRKRREKEEEESANEARAATDAAAQRAKLPEPELEELRRRAIEEGVSEEALEEAIRTFAEKQENSGRKKLKVRGGGGGGIRIQGVKQA